MELSWSYLEILLGEPRVGPGTFPETLEQRAQMLKLFGLMLMSISAIVLLGWFYERIILDRIPNV